MKEAVAGSLAAVSMLALSGIVRADGGGETTTTGDVNPCENPSNGRSPNYCKVDELDVDICYHNNETYICAGGVQLRSPYLEGQCFVGHCVYP